LGTFKDLQNVIESQNWELEDFDNYTIVKTLEMDRVRGVKRSPPRI